MKLTFIVLASYLLGSIPFSFLIAKSKGVSLSEEGTKNLGASNVALTAGFGLGLAALIFDILKGFAAVVFARILIGSDLAAVLSALAAVLGHDFSIYLRFKGGKGFATSGGAFLAINPYLVFVLIAVYWIIYFLVRSFIPSTLILLTLLPAFAWLFGLGAPYIILGVLFALLAYYTHRNDIMLHKHFCL